jgi:flagellar biosynthesis/type III secretory pathway protein FliH
VRRGEAEFQEGIRSGYEPGVKAGGKMRDNSLKRIREIQAELDELYKKL